LLSEEAADSFDYRDEHVEEDEAVGLSLPSLQRLYRCAIQTSNTHQDHGAGPERESARDKQSRQERPETQLVREDRDSCGL